MRWTARRIKILREHCGEAQPAFAARLGLSVDTLRDYEQPRRGKVPPAYIARLLDCLQWKAEHGGVGPNPDPRYRKTPPMPAAEENTEDA